MNSFQFVYSIIILLALLLSFSLAKSFKNIDAFKFYVATCFVIITAFVGARIYYLVLFRNASETINFASILSTAGTGSYGAYIGGFIGAFLVFKYFKIDLMIALDIYSPILGLSLFIGRVGCFIGGCCYGKPTSLPWGVPNRYIAFSSLDEVPLGRNINLPICYVNVHPTQIYEALFGLLMFIFIIIRLRKTTIRGLLFTYYVMAYAIFRFFNEYLRGDNHIYIVGMSIPQIISITIFLFSIFNLIYINKSKNALYFNSQ